MTTSIIRYFLGLAALIFFMLPAIAAADPPARVGRLSQLEGNAIFRADRQDPGSPATINWPVSSGAIIDTERRSRAEIWIGSTAYRLAANSRAEFVTINDQIVDLLLASGTLSVTLRDRDQADDLQISTPGGRVRFPDPGRFRIEVRPDRTTVAAKSGNVEIIAGERSINVQPGEAATLDERGLLGIDGAPYGDDFDAWVSTQDNRERSHAARRHVSPYMTGYQDLDAYGDWSSAPDYGTVWYPRAVAADWAPYRDGRWAWIEPWGWTWVDAAPWGFAPFHYGRWVQVGGRWGWAPGTYAARPVYAPALVGWVGDPGRNPRLGYNPAPAVGWFPLAPREVYVPGYRASPSYARRINVAHVHDHAYIDRAQRPDYRPNYAHQRQPHAVTVVPANTMREGRPINLQNIRPYDKKALEQASAKPRAPGGEWLAPPGGATRTTQPGQSERYPQQQPARPPAEHFQQPTTVAPRGVQVERRDQAAPPGYPQESRGRPPEQQGAPTSREFRRDADNAGRSPHSEDRPSGQPMRGAPRADDRPQPAMPAPASRDERYRQTPPALREVPAPVPVQHEQRRDIHREPQQYREPPQPRQPQPERATPIPREAPRAMPAQPQFQAQPQAQPQRQPPPSAPPMREMPRNEPRPPPQADHNRHSHAPDDRRGERGQR